MLTQKSKDSYVLIFSRQHYSGKYQQVTCSGMHQISYCVSGHASKDFCSG